MSERQYTDASVPTSRPRLTPKQWDEIVRRYREGEEGQNLAKEFGVSAASIRHRVSHA